MFFFYTPHPDLRGATLPSMMFGVVPPWPSDHHCGVVGMLLLCQPLCVMTLWKAQANSDLVGFLVVLELHMIRAVGLSVCSEGCRTTENWKSHMAQPVTAPDEHQYDRLPK